jgi:antitoxin component of MazEF toxin-antitoxin module
MTKITRIGNSRGVCIPGAVINQLGLTTRGLNRRDTCRRTPPHTQKNKLSWAETAQARAQAKEDWSDLENASADGLADL